MKNILGRAEIEDPYLEQRRTEVPPVIFEVHVVLYTETHRIGVL